MDLLGIKNKQSLQDTNDVLNVFWSFKQPINSDNVQLIKDFATVIYLDPKTFAIMFLRSILSVDRIYFLQSYGISRKDCEEIKNSDNKFKTAFEKLSIYEGAYNKIKGI